MYELLFRDMINVSSSDSVNQWFNVFDFHGFMIKEQINSQNCCCELKIVAEEQHLVKKSLHIYISYFYNFLFGFTPNRKGRTL